MRKLLKQILQELILIRKELRAIRISQEFQTKDTALIQAVGGGVMSAMSSAIHGSVSEVQW